MKHHLRVTVGMLGLCAVMFLSGCGVGMISFLTKDNMEKDRGLIMLRLRAKDPTEVLRIGGAPRFILQKQRDNDQEDWIRLEICDGDKRAVWKKEKDTYYFDQYYYLQGKPGRYFIKYLHFDLGTSRSPGYKSTIVTYNWLNVPLNTAFDIKNNGLVFIGTIDFELNSVKRRNNRYNPFDYASLNYTWRINDSQEQKDNIFKHFKARYPLLSTRYTKDQITGRPFYGFYSNFNRKVPSSSDESKRWLELKSETCNIGIRKEKKRALVLDGKNSDKNKHGYSTMTGKVSLPNTYNIHYKVRWLAGINDGAYGFQIRQNTKNIYYFAATAEGMPIVWIKKDGQWFEKPKTNRVSSFLSSPEQADDFRIEFKNGWFTYKINNEVASTFKDVLGNARAKIGFFVSGTQKVAVDSIAVSGR